MKQVFKFIFVELVSFPRWELSYKYLLAVTGELLFF